MAGLWNRLTQLLIPVWLRNWAERLPFTDPIAYKQAHLLQILLISLSVLILLAQPNTIVISPSLKEAARISAPGMLDFFACILSIIFLRRGKFRQAALTVSGGFVFSLVILTVFEGLRGSWVLPAFLIPMTLAGLLTGRRGTLIIASLSIVSVMVVGLLQVRNVRWIGVFSREPDILNPTISTFVLSVAISAFFFFRFNASLREALVTAHHALARSQVLVTERTAALEEVRTIRDHQEILIAERTRDLTAINQKMRKDLALAHDIQLGLLPTHVPWSPETALGVGRSIPAADVGGDFYTFIAFDDPRYIAVAVGDISGKGVGAALMMALMLSAVEAEARINVSPAAVLTALNQHWYGRLKSNHMNAALTFLLIDLEIRTLRVANGGMIFPMLISDGLIRAVEIGEFPLGSLPNMRYAEQTVTFRPGDMVVLQSDGVVEAHNSQGELFGFDRMEAAINALETPTLEQMVDAVFHSVSNFTGEAVQHDDITMVAVQMDP